jgi:hypothetical protein
MADPISVNDILGRAAEAKVIAYNAKFIDAMQMDIAENDYLRDWIHVPEQSIDPSVFIVRYPIPLTSTELEPFTGRRKFGQNATKFADVTKATYQKGEHEYYKKIAAVDWVGFSMAPKRLAFIVKTWVAKNGAELLNKGETLKAWNGSFFFSTSIRENYVKRAAGGRTYRNYYPATPLTHDNVQMLIADMAARRGMIGENLGLQGDTLFCSPELWPTARSIAEDDRLASGATNPIKKYGLKVKKLQHLAANRWGLIHENAMDRYPVFGAIESPEEFNTWGRESTMFETSMKMGWDIVVDLGIALLRQEAISLAVTV